MIRSLFRRSGLHFGGSIISKIFTSTVYILLSRYISPEEYGQATLAVTCILLGTIVGDYGLSQWYQKQDDERKAFGTFSKMRLTLAAVTALSLFSILTLSGWLPKPLAIITSLVLLPHAATSVASAYLIRAKSVLKPSLQQVIQAIPVLAAIFFMGHNITVFIATAAYFVGSMSAALLLFPFARIREITSAHVRYRATMRAATKYALLNYTSATYARADSVLVRGYLGEAALGFYGLAYRYMEYFALLPSSLVQVAFPLFAQNKKIGTRHIFTMTLIMTIGGMLFSLVLAAAAPIIIATLHGPSYTPAITIMQILSATLFFMFINAPLSAYVQSSDFVKKFLPFGIANTLFNVMLNITLIPIFGMQGAAFAMMISEITGLFINIYFAKKLSTSI